MNTLIIFTVIIYVLVLVVLIAICCSFCCKSTEYFSANPGLDKLLKQLLKRRSYENYAEYREDMLERTSKFWNIAQQFNDCDSLHKILTTMIKLLNYKPLNDSTFKPTTSEYYESLQSQIYTRLIQVEKIVRPDFRDTCSEINNKIENIVLVTQVYDDIRDYKDDIDERFNTLRSMYYDYYERGDCEKLLAMREALILFSIWKPMVAGTYHPNKNMQKCFEETIIAQLKEITKMITKTCK